MKVSSGHLSVASRIPFAVRSAPRPLTEPTRTQRSSRGRDSPGPLTEATRLYLSRAQSGEPFFNAGRAPRFYLYSADSGAGPSNGGLSRLWVSRRAARIYVYSADTGTSPDYGGQSGSFRVSPSQASLGRPPVQFR